MCGIAGFFELKKSTSARNPSKVLRDMVGTLRHRGPDSEGFYEEEGVGLGMRRLRVIDLATGDQPISNDQKSLWIIFNGEIYNYQQLREGLKKKGFHFKTETDTEVLLKLYEEKGRDCVEGLNGMYAFSIYDARDKSLFVARDPLGIKPLYYYQDSDTFVFASEPKAILKFPGVTPALDLEAVSHFLSFNYLPSPWTLFDGIRQLEGGHSLTIKDGSLREERFWNPVLQERKDLSENEIVEKTRFLLRESVASQLVADVPVGAFLSGGLDSSSLVALVKECRQGSLETFSVGFEEESYDESPYARRVANYFGTRHHEIFVKPAEIPGLLEALVSQLDQPLADPAALALFQLSSLARQSVTVALSGDGADEIFVGYPTYHANRYLAWYQSFPTFIRKGLLEPLTKLLPSSTSKLSFDYKVKKFMEGAQFGRAKAHFWWRTIFSDDEKKRLLAGSLKPLLNGSDSYSIYHRHYEDASELEFTNQCLYADLRVWLAGNNLHKVDSMSMAHSLEARVPYLDQELVEFLMTVPASIKFKGHETKYLLKKVMRGLLPDEVITRKKAGWHLPFASWFRYPLKDFLTQRFQEDSKSFYEVFDKASLQTLLGEHFRGTRNNSFKIWGLLVLHEWFKKYQPA